MTGGSGTVDGGAAADAAGVTDMATTATTAAHKRAIATTGNPP